jgi:hypothetical protein
VPEPDGSGPGHDLARLITSLDRHGVAYLLAGGAAARAYGATRLTEDELATRERLIEGEGFTIHAAALEDIITAKERADRPKDREALPELRALRRADTAP